MALPAFVQQVNTPDTAGFNNTLQSAAFASSPTTGNAIVVAVFLEKSPSDATSVTDTQANTYVRMTPSSVFSTTVGISLWICQNITGGATFKVTANDTNSDIVSFVAMEISGLPTSGAIVDGYTSISAASVTANTLSASLSTSTTNANDILLMFSCINGTSTGTWTAGSLGGSTGANLASGNVTSMTAAYASETQVVSTTGTYSGSFGYTTSANNCSLIVALSNTVIVSTVNKGAALLTMFGI